MNPLRSLSRSSPAPTVRHLGAAAAGASLVLLAACGSSSPSPPQAVGTPTASAPAPAGGASPSSAASAPASGAAAQAPVPVEKNPPGDIPDNVAFLDYRNAAGGYGFTHPEGWAQTEQGTQVTFTDKLNGIQADTSALPSALTVDTVKSTEVPRLSTTQPAFTLSSVQPVNLPAGKGVRIVYRRNSAPDPVTGRQVRDEVEEFLVGSGAKGVRLELFGPVGADNVDAYRTITQSLTLA